MIQSKPKQTPDSSRKSNSRLSLQTRLVLLVLLVALVPLIIIATRDILQTQQTLTNTAEISLKASALETANNVDNFILTTLNSINGETRFTEFTTYLTPSSEPVAKERALNILKNLTNKDVANIISYALVDVNGNVLLDTAESNIRNNETGETYFSLVRFSNQPIVAPSTNSNDKTPGITFATKVINLKGDYIGILRVKYKLSVFQDVIVQSVGQSNDVSVLLLDPFYLRMADIQNPDLILSKVPLELKQLQQSFFRADITPKTSGDDTIAISYLHTLPWIIVYSRPTSVFVEGVQKEIRTNIIIVLGALFIMSISTALIARSLTNPIIALAKVADAISQGDLSARSHIDSTDEIGVLASTFNRMAEELNQSFTVLETRVAERTTDLEIARRQSEKRANELQSIGEIARIITGEQRLENLLPLISRLVSERFGFYHTGIFLIDETNQFAVLQAANSEGGKNMVDRGYRLEIGEGGIVGHVVKFGTSRIALDVGSDAIYFDNPDLPNTRSEMALPLKVRDRIVGVLDVQSEKPGAFTDDDANTLGILADQVAIALENARLFTQTQQALSEAQALYRQNLQAGWLTFSREEPSIGYHQTLQGGKKLVKPVETNEIRQAMNRGAVLVFNANGSAQESSIVVPIKLRGQIIGALNIKAPDPNRRWTNDEVNLAEVISERLSLALENARLIQESQRQAIKEQTISEVTGKIGASIDLKNVLQTAVEELGRAMPGSEVLIKFHSEESNGHRKQET